MLEYPRTNREVVRDESIEISRDFDAKGRLTDVWYKFNNYRVFSLEVKYDDIGRVHQWRRRVGIDCLILLSLKGHRHQILTDFSRAVSCRSSLESQWETPNFDPPVEPKLVGDRAENWQD